MILGIALFALGIIVSIVLHEYGHMSVALATGMKVRRFFVGFGPTVFSFRRSTPRHGEIEYGFKALPLGGFCDIAGMTAYDTLDPVDEPRAMWRQSAWKRIAVLLAGPAMNILLGMVIFYVVAVGWGLPNLDRTPIPVDRIPAVVGSTSCLGRDCTGKGPAGEAGFRSGDEVTALASLPVRSWGDLSDIVRDRPGETIPAIVVRNGVEIPLTVTLASVPASSGARGAIGIALEERAIPVTVQNSRSHQWVHHYDALGAVPGTLSFTGEVLVETAKGIATFPTKIPAVARSISGGERSADSPVSVVGASHIGGQVAARSDWQSFLLILGSLNLFIGGFNLIPLTPFDGGHIAVVLYERIRDAVRRVRGLAPGGPADYERLAPLTMTVFAVLIAVSSLVIVADVVNPIMLPG